jgi:sialic acid synthase SpsE
VPVPPFIAEVSSNHHRDLARCLQFVETAADIGCRAVKFQLFRARELFAPEILARSAFHRRREEWELPEAFLPILSKRAHELGIEFSCTPFHLGAVEAAAPFVDFFKIASYELLWHDLLRACAQTGKPVVLSTGMATLPEVQAAVRSLRIAGCRDLTLLHCVSSYPTPPGACNLAAIETLRSACECPVGWSDHSVSEGVIHRAVLTWGAAMVEFHLDLDGSGPEYSMGHCWLPEAIGAVIRSLNEGELADGSDAKAPAEQEMGDRSWRADPSDGLRPLLATRVDWDGDRADWDGDRADGP